MEREDIGVRKSMRSAIHSRCVTVPRHAMVMSRRPRILVEEEFETATYPAQLACLLHILDQRDCLKKLGRLMLAVLVA